MIVDMVRSPEPIRFRAPRPGLITAQVIQNLVEWELVIADLSEHNPNVFYELAVRHALKKPIVQLIQAGQKIPFDVIRCCFNANHKLRTSEPR